MARMTLTHVLFEAVERILVAASWSVSVYPAYRTGKA